MTVYKPTRRGVFAKQNADKTYTLAMSLTGYTVHVTAVNTSMTDDQIRTAAMAWYPNARNVIIER